MKTHRLFAKATAVLGLTLSMLSAKADDMYIWAVEEGGDVIIYYSGSVDTTGMVFDDPFQPRSAGYIYPTNGAVQFSTGSVVGTSFNLPPFSYESRNIEDEFTSLAEGDSFGIGGKFDFLPEGYVSGSPLTGSMTFSDRTLDELGIDPTPFDIQDEEGQNVFHFFQEPELLYNTSTGGADLLIGKTATRLKGDNVLDRRKASAAQTITHQSKIFRTNTVTAYLALQNDSSAAAALRLRTSGDTNPRMTVTAKVAGRGANIAAALKSGRFAPNVAPGASVRVTYALKTNRYFAGVLRGSTRNDEIGFRLSGPGGADNAAMVNSYR